jgi:hypothetical protein
MRAANRVPDLMSAADFRTGMMPDGSARWELIDVIPHAMEPASPWHGAIQAEVMRLIGNHLADLRPACRIAVEAGIQPRVCADHNIRVPDVVGRLL